MAIIARACDRGRDFNLTSLGFGGQCHADPLIARLIRDLPADFVSIKIGINIYGAASLSPRAFRPAILGTIATIRDGHPHTPFAVCSPIWGHDRETTPNTVGLTLEQMRIEVREAVESFKKRGDQNIYYVDGLKLFDESLALITSWYLHNAGAITIGTIYLIISYTGTLSGPLRRLTRQMEDLQKASASLVRIEELLAIATRIHDGPGLALNPGPTSIEFRNLTFSYNEEEPVLHDLSFRLESGRILGLLGRTGSGKTTIARLLFRLYDPQQGQILFGGSDIRQMRLAELRNSVGMVTQSVQLFRATIRDNLTFFDPTRSWCSKTDASGRYTKSRSIWATSTSFLA